MHSGPSIENAAPTVWVAGARVAIYSDKPESEMLQQVNEQVKQFGLEGEVLSRKTLKRGKLAFDAWVITFRPSGTFLDAPLAILEMQPIPKARIQGFPGGGGITVSTNDASCLRSRFSGNRSAASSRHWRTPSIQPSKFSATSLRTLG